MASMLPLELPVSRLPVSALEIAPDAALVRPPSAGEERAPVQKIAVKKPALPRTPPRRSARAME